MNTPNKKRFKNTGGVQGRYVPLKGMLTLPPKELRLKLGLTQSDFWSPVGISQSGGSRYESGRKLPAATSALLHLVHIEGLNINQLNGDDFRVGKHFRETNPAGYAVIVAKVGHAL